MKDEMNELSTDPQSFVGTCPMCGQRYCADEIEALRAALKEIADSGDFSSGSDWSDLVLTRYIARKALTGRLSGKE
jgi:hypothetical protein